MTWARRIEDRRAQRQAEREANLRALAIPSRSLHRGTYAGGTTGRPIAKEDPVRSEAYRRLVAVLPCAFCGVVGYSQAAHPNTGKGMGLKTDDRRAFPMCGPRAGIAGCHARLDQGALLTKEQRRTFEEDAGRNTRETITASGMWPEGLPMLEARKEEA